MPHLFVYGSLKQGFPNFHVNQGRRIAGDFKTALRHPFYQVRGQLPCLLPADGSGLQVLGQVFEVTNEDLAVMDALERVGQPRGLPLRADRGGGRAGAGAVRGAEGAGAEDQALKSRP